MNQVMLITPSHTFYYKLPLWRFALNTKCWNALLAFIQYAMCDRIPWLLERKWRSTKQRNAA